MAESTPELEFWNSKERMQTRRQFLAMASAAWLGRGPSGTALAAARPTFQQQLQRAIAPLEKTTGGRLGVAVLDTATGARYAHRGDERFPMCSTFKVLLASAVLTRVTEGRENLDRRIVYTARDLVTYSPETKKHVGTGMTVAQLCLAALTLSDNTAANLLLASIGGPAAVTRFARSLGDEFSRLDRIETALNEALPGDPRDTTTPLAMLANLQRLLLGSALAPAARRQLTEWMLQNKTSDERLRAGVPKTWRIADKTGTGDHGTYNDIGVLWPPQQKPVVLTIYLTGATCTSAQGSAAIADVARAVAEALG